MAIPPPPQNLAPNPSFETAAGNVVVRQNYIANPKMDNSIFGWSTSAPVTQAPQVGGSLITFPSAVSSYPASVFSTTTAVAAPSESWYAAMDVTVPVGQPAGTFTISARPYAGVSAIGGDESANVTIQPGTTVRLVSPITVLPATTDSIRLWLNVRGAGVQAGSQITIKDAVLEKSSVVQPYFDGSTPVKVRRNLAGFPVPTATYPFNSNNTSYYTVAYDAAKGRRPGTGSSVATRLAAAPSQVLASWYNVGSYSWNNTGRAKVNPGQVITASAYGSLSIVGQVNLAAYFYDTAGTQVGVQSNGAQTQAPTPGEWYRASVTVTVPANAVTVGIMAYANGPSGYVSVGGELSWVTDVLIEEGSTVGEWFDGSTTSAPYVGVWEGAANNSPSYLKDPDFTYTWLSLVNQSASIQTGVGVANVGSTANVSACIQSSHWANSGVKSLRIIPLGTNSASYADIPVPVLAGRTYTLTTTLRLSAPLAGTLNQDSRKMSLRQVPSVQSNQYSPQAPNTAGTYAYRWTFTVAADTSTASVRPLNGATVGNGDAWFDDVQVYEGTKTPEEYYLDTGFTNADLELAYLTTVKGAAGPTLNDARRQIYGEDANAYFAGVSGLSPSSYYTINDHKYAYYRTQSGFDGTINDCARIFWMRRLTGNPGP